MKKSLVITLALVFVLGIVSTAFAAANPFVDVPAKHWAYESVAKLAKAGIVDGYGDGTFRGDKTMTRYEMAQVVAKAMANSDKADAALKAEIAKLQVEFASELNNLGVRVAKLEKNASTIKFTGEVRQRYEWADNKYLDNKALTRLRIKMEAAVNDSWTMKGRLAKESGISVGEAPTIDQLYFVGTLADLKATIGRQPLTLGKGLLMDTSSNWEGVRFDAGSVAKVSVGSVKRDALTYMFANVAYAPVKAFELTGTYFKDVHSTKYKAWTTGFAYTGLDKVALVGEYGKNDVAGAHKAWYVQAKYAGAKTAEVGTFGLWVSYRKAEAGFDPTGYSTLYTTGTGGWTKQQADNVKGFEYGFDYTLAKNIVMNARYMPLKSYNGATEMKQFIAEVNYFF